MLFTLQTPRWEAQAAEFRTLHLSLNAPVIAIAQLPVGPARAGIALCAEASGSLRLQIAIRSLQTSEVIAFGPTDEPTGEDDAALALEAGLSFAEGMGFLFDDEEATSRTAGDCTAVWREFVGEAPLRDAETDVADAAGLAEPPVVDLVHEIPVQVSPPNFEPVRIEVEFVRSASSSPGIASTGVLSKHRLALGGIGSPGASRTALRRVGESVAASTVHSEETRIRLLSRF